MSRKDPRVDAYIEKSPHFAKPVLRHLRNVVHAACPQVEETMKWNMPHFQYHGMMCSMAAFKRHCTFGFWKGELVFGGKAPRDAMGHFGRITSVDDLPSPRTLAGYVKKAMKLNDAGVRASRVATPRPRPPLAPPRWLMDALSRNRKALAAFESFSPSHRREYIEWIIEAKTDATRERRVSAAVEWMADGKPRNWKYR